VLILELRNYASNLDEKSFENSMIKLEDLNRDRIGQYEEDKNDLMQKGDKVDQAIEQTKSDQTIFKNTHKNLLIKNRFMSEVKFTSKSILIQHYSALLNAKIS
jgi:hypothetical protein